MCEKRAEKVKMSGGRLKPGRWKLLWFVSLCFRSLCANDVSVITFTQEGVLKNDDSALKLICTVVWMTDDVSTAAQLSSCCFQLYHHTVYTWCGKGSRSLSRVFKSSARLILHARCLRVKPCLIPCSMSDTDHIGRECFYFASFLNNEKSNPKSTLNTCQCPTHTQTHTHTQFYT